MIFSTFIRKYFLLFALSSASTCFAQSHFIEVAYTPYDHQMQRIQPVLTAAGGYSFDRLSFALVNGWMVELRGMPYRFSREWRTPSEVESARVGDCKGKALALYDRMQLNGASNLRFVIGKRRVNDSLTHAWLEWDTEFGTVLLDPTFNWTATIKTADPRSYVPFYGYHGAHKYQAANTQLIARTLDRRSPAAPAHGVITRPTRANWQSRSRLSSSNDGLTSPRFVSNRSAF